MVSLKIHFRAKKPVVAFMIELFCIGVGLVGMVSCVGRLVDVGRFPPAVVKLSVEPYRQKPERCGPYSLAAAMNYLGREVDVADLDSRLYLPKLNGTLTLDLYLETVRVGVTAAQRTGDWQTIRADLEGGCPPILLLRYPSLVGGLGHYVVVTGYSRVPDGYFLLWGDGRESWMAESALTTMWSRSGWWFLSFCP